jgi:nucleoside-diphosphate-sugar epimerase
MALYLVTGGCGFIGSNLVQALIGRGERVRVVDNLSTGRQENLASLLAARPQQLELWRGEIDDPDLLSRALRDVDYVLHQAAMPSVPWSFAQPLDCDRVNLRGTLQLLEAVRRRRQGPVKRLVLAASCAVYGDLEPERPKRESDLPAPLSPYAIAKLASEQLCTVYSRVHGVPTVALRYFNVFGPRQDPSSTYAAAIPRFVTAALQGQSPTIYGDGRQSRDFCFVDNIVDANLRACSAPAAAVSGQVVNIGCGRAVSLLEVVAELSRLLGRPIAPQHEPARDGEVRHSWADIAAAERLLGYRPQVDFGQGLEKTLAWYRDRVERGASR